MSSTKIHADGNVFELRRDMTDATSMHRPNVGFAIIDAAGHSHAWCVMSPIGVPCFESGLFVCQKCGRTEVEFVGPCTMQVQRNGEWENCGGWFMSAVPATHYNPAASYTMPSLVWVKDGEEYWDGDDEPHDVGHNECRLCGEHIEPPYTADASRVFVPGLMHCYINGVEVGRGEFKRRYEVSRGREVDV